MKGFLAESDISSNSEANESYVRDIASKMKVFHVTDNHFRIFVNNNKYRLLDRLQIYNRRMAAKTGKHVKRMKTIMIASKFDEKHPTTVLSFHAQFRRAYDSN